jgi:hypothetical protein
MQTIFSRLYHYICLFFFLWHLHCKQVHWVRALVFHWFLCFNNICNKECCAATDDQTCVTETAGDSEICIGYSFKCFDGDEGCTTQEQQDQTCKYGALPGPFSSCLELIDASGSYFDVLCCNYDSCNSIDTSTPATCNMPSPSDSMYPFFSSCSVVPGIHKNFSLSKRLLCIHQYWPHSQTYLASCMILYVRREITQAAQLGHATRPLVWLMHHRWQSYSKIPMNSLMSKCATIICVRRTIKTHAPTLLHYLHQASSFPLVLVFLFTKKRLTSPVLQEISIPFRSLTLLHLCQVLTLLHQASFFTITDFYKKADTFALRTQNNACFSRIAACILCSNRLYVLM